MKRTAIRPMVLLGALLLFAQGAASAGPDARSCNAFIPCAADRDCPPTGGTVRYKCVDDPTDDCLPPAGPPECPGICVLPMPEFCGGFPLFPCPPGTTCIETATQGCSMDCGGSDCGGECVLLADGARPCHGKNRTKCSQGLTCLDNMFDGCHEACGGVRCDGFCGGVAPDTCVPGDPRGCPDRMICAHFTDFTPYPSPPEGKDACGLLPDLSCVVDIDCPPGMVCGDNPDDNCDPARGRECLTCCVTP